MRRTQRIFSQKFLGITLVPFHNGKPRRTQSMIYSDGYFAAIVGSAKVAVSSDDAFKPNFVRNDYVQRSLARVLLQLGAVSQENYDQFNEIIKSILTDKARKKMAERAVELEDVMGDLGIALTPEQQAKLNSFLEIKAL